MKLNFVKLSPTRNITILVSDPVPRERHAAIAAQLMDGDCVGGEQVGYIEAPALSGARARLQMMGGEFCGNAGMSLAAWLARCDEMPDGAEAEIPLEVSGADGLVICRILRRGDAYEGTVSMPLPEKTGFIEGWPAVFFDGIIHAIVPESAMTDDEALAFARAQCAAQEADAFGVLLVNKNSSAFRPLVYVRSTDSAVWEHGCGSGTAAIGAHTAVERRENVCLDLAQPGGVIRVEAEWNGAELTALRITGTIRITAAGTAWING